MIDDALLSKYDIHDAEELRATLPKVGDRLMLRPTLYDKAGAWPAHALRGDLRQPRAFMV